MRGDYVDKFLGQWTAALSARRGRRVVRDAAYPYAATETCVGHATISTGAFSATHGMVANSGGTAKNKNGHLHADPDPSVKNTGYAGATPKGADTAWRMAVPSFARGIEISDHGERAS